MKILILGYTGFIGSNLVENLQKIKLAPYLFDRKSYQVQIPGTGNTVDLSSFLKSLKEELLIVNLFASWGNVEKEQIFAANFSAPDSVLNLVMQYSKKFTWIQISSYYQFYRILYGKDKDYYSECKRLFSEKLDMVEESRANFIELFLPHVYGKNDKSNRVIPMLLDTRSDSELRLSKGDQLLPLLNVNDCVYAIIDLLKNYQKFKGHSKFYLKDFQQISLRDIVEIVISESGFKPRVIFSDNLSRKNEFFSAINSPFRIYNYEPLISFSSYVKSRRK